MRKVNHRTFLLVLCVLACLIAAAFLVNFSLFSKKLVYVPANYLTADAVNANDDAAANGKAVQLLRRLDAIAVRINNLPDRASFTPVISKVEFRPPVCGIASTELSVYWNNLNGALSYELHRFDGSIVALPLAKTKLAGGVRSYTESVPVPSTQSYELSAFYSWGGTPLSNQVAKYIGCD